MIETKKSHLLFTIPDRLTSNSCTTCNLNQAQCPGHPGHIELPVSVYHPVFMDQAYRLLRSQCVYCHRFRLARREIHRYACMLRLLQVGLLKEAQMIDAINDSDLSEAIRGMTISDVPQIESDEAQEDGNNVQDNIIRARERYVRETLQKHRQEISLGTIRKGKHEGASEMRRGLIKEFLGKIVLEKTCRTCDGISPAYRKDRYVKIFERELTEKEKAAMIQAGRKKANVLTLTHRQKKPDFDQDEAIADIDLSSNEEEEQEDEGEGEELDENGDVVMGEAASKPAEKLKGVRGQRYLSPTEVKERLNLLFEKEQEMMGLLYHSKPRPKNAEPLDASMFFLQTLLVPPNRYRPEARMGDSEVTESQQNNLYKLILRNSVLVGQLKIGRAHV